VIGHMKSDGLLQRNHLAGATGDAINAILAAAGHNLRLLLAWLRLLCAWLLAARHAHLRRAGAWIAAVILSAVPHRVAA